MNNDIKEVSPFDSLTEVYKILAWTGYYKPLNKPVNKFKRISHQIYRRAALLLVIVYNVQHLIFTVQHSHDMAKLMDCLVIEIPQMNLLAKVSTMFVQSRRIDKIYELLSGPTFAATDDTDKSLLQKNVVEMHRLSKIMNIGVIIASFFWPVSFFVKRYNDHTETVNSYVPFKTDTWAKFSISVFLETGPILWTGFGHISLDCLIATYYALAQTILKMIKHQLHEMLPETPEDISSRREFHYKDLTDETVSRRFVQIVKRYEKLVWYKNEVDIVFNFPLSFQFLSSASVVCLVIYRMTILSVTSFAFIFLALLFCLLLTQVFMYCFYGNLVEFESRTINDSIYGCDWMSSSPAFRRSMLIAMTRWSHSLQPKVSGIIPLSLSTFVSIVKSSYTLYTVLVVTAN